MEEFKVSEKGTISLVIKTPSQVHGDQLIEDVNISWTVKELKTHLARVHASKPAEQDQRLIYSGKLLLDHLNIRDVFRTADMVPTIHLVCSIRLQPGPQQSTRPKVRPTESPALVEQSMDAGSRVPSVSTMPSVPSTSAGLRQRGHHLPPTASTTPTTPGAATSRPVTAPLTQPTFPAYSLYTPQQIMWLQQMYARQYYMQYHAAMAASSSPPAAEAAAPPSSSLPIAPHQPALDNLPVNQNAPDPALLHPQPPNQNLRMNAQGGPVVEDEEDAQWDWLDWVYTASRLAMLLNIVYFYSKPSRFILVMCLLFIMHLHTAGWFPFRNRARARNQNQPAAEVNQNQEDQNQARQPEQAAPPAAAEVDQAEAGAEAEVENAAQPSMIAVPVPAVRPPLLWTAWGFFKAFFASLIPEVPQGVAN